jgi:hypothetical protein
MRGNMMHGGEWVWMRDPLTKQIVELNWYPQRSSYFERWKAGVEMDHLGWSIRDIEHVLPKLNKLGAKVKADFVQGNVRLTFIADGDGIWHEFLSWTERGRMLRGGSPGLLQALPPGRAREAEKKRRAKGSVARRRGRVSAALRGRKARRRGR